MSDQYARKSVVRSERGVAMVVTMLTLVLLLTLALAVIQNSVASLRTSGNDRSTKSAYAIAEAGAEYAREQLRETFKGGTTINQALTAAANGGNLVDASLLTSFGTTTGVSNQTTNRPLVRVTPFAAGNFQVFLTNDRAESGAASVSASVSSKTDTNNRVMITSFGTGPTGSLAVVQEQLRVFDAFLPGLTLPGVVVLPGPTVSFNAPNSSAAMVSGIDLNNSNHCYPTVAVTTQAAWNVVVNEIPQNGNKADNFQSCGAFSGGNNSASTVENFLATSVGSPNPYDGTTNNAPSLAGDPRLISVKYLNNLVSTISSVADFHSLSDSGFTWGTTTSPKIVALSGDQQISGNFSGAGILLVTGKFTLTGTPSYNGLILVIGTGDLEYKGNGNGEIDGAILVANTSQPWVKNGVTTNYVGMPTYNDVGGGSHVQQYDETSLSRYANAVMPLQVLTFQDLH